MSTPNSLLERTKQINPLVRRIKSFDFSVVAMTEDPTPMNARAEFCAHCRRERNTPYRSLWPLLFCGNGEACIV